MFCTNCGQQIPVDAHFCQKCGKAVNTNRGQEVLNIEEIRSSRVTFNNSGLAIEFTVGIGILFLMYLFGEIVTYRSVFERGAIGANMGSFVCYGVLFGFAVRTVPATNRSRKAVIEQGLGGALTGGVAATIVYVLLYKAIEGHQEVLTFIGYLLFTLSLPLAKSIKLSLGLNGFRYSGVCAIKKNFKIGFISGLIGLGLAMMMEAARINSSIYGLLGIIGFLNYFCLTNLGKPKQHKLLQ